MDKIKPQIIAIVAGSGVGKTFLVKKLGAKLGAKTIIEKNLPKEVIENLTQGKNYLETLFWFRQKLIKEIEIAQLLKKQGNIIILDTFWESNNLYIKDYTEGFMQKTLQEYVNVTKKHLPKPDKIIYLDASKEKILQHLKQRDGWSFDKKKKHLLKMLKIKKSHDQYYLENSDKVFYVNRDNLDFDREEDLQIIIDIIKNPNPTPESHSNYPQQKKSA